MSKFQKSLVKPLAILMTLLFLLAIVTPVYAEDSGAVETEQLTEAQQEELDELLGTTKSWKIKSATRSNLSTYVVALDAGHGGSDSGAVGNGLLEKDLNLRIALACKKRLESYGVTVYMTRSGDTRLSENTAVDLAARVSKAKAAGAVAFVCLHCNSGGGNGAEVWCANGSSWYYDPCHTQSEALANAILGKLTNGNPFGIARRGVYTRDYGSGYSYPDGSMGDYYAVIRHSRENTNGNPIPALIVEHGFVSNTSDAINLNKYAEAIGEADAEGIIEVLGVPREHSAWFVDVWKDDETNHASDIDWLAENGIAQGWTLSNGDRVFRGMDTVKRQDMAAFLRREAILMGVTDASTWKPSDSDWAISSDVDSSTPHAEDILWLAHAGIAQGYQDGTFRGMTPVYRQDMAAFLHRLARLAGKTGSAVSDSTFSDVTASTAHVTDIRWLASRGVASGYSNGTFRGMTPAYRQDAAAFLHRLAQLEASDDSDMSDDVDIMGTSAASAADMVAAYKRSGATYPASTYESLGAATIEDYVDTLVEVSEGEGVRADVVFAQAMLETNWLRFGGDVKPEQCNFAGIGATGGGEPGNSFPDVRTGLLAQVQHLKAYAGSTDFYYDHVDPRYYSSIVGKAKTVERLGGTWAADLYYGDKILAIMAGL